MTQRLVLGVFTEESDVVRAVEKTREAGYAIRDVFTPYAVHGLDEAMGLKRTRLPWVCLGFALFGLLLAMWFQYWIGAIDWPLNVGGRPFNSLPAYLPVMFELTVLFGGLGVVFTLFIRARLLPGKKETLIEPRVTDDHFVIAVEKKTGAFNQEKLEHLWQEAGLLATHQIEDDS